jgi:NADH-quinone oxidoreductase subunit M
MLSALIMLPLVGAFALIFVDRTNAVFIRNFSLFWSLLVFNFSVLLLAGFDPLVSNFQFIESISWLPFANTDILFAVDGLSILLIILTTFLIPVCVLLCWKMPNQTLLKDYNIAFLLLEAILIGIFCSLDLLVFLPSIRSGSNTNVLYCRYFWITWKKS